jgi:nitrate reductase gamma subunit
LIWISPLLARPVAGLTGVPVGLLATLCLFALVLRRLHRQRDRAVASLRLSQL